MDYTWNVMPVYGVSTWVIVMLVVIVLLIAALVALSIYGKKLQDRQEDSQRQLQEAGLTFADIQPVYLTPADARAAFQQKNVDAWAIWDPYYSAALLQGGVRVLKDGTTLKQTGSFYLAARPYAEKNGAFIQGVLETFTQADALTQSQRQESITLLAKTMGLPEPVIASYLDHRPPTTIAPVDAHVAALQQQTADLFYQNRLVPKQVDIRDRIWQPAGKEGAKS